MICDENAINGLYYIFAHINSLNYIGEINIKSYLRSLIITSVRRLVIWIANYLLYLITKPLATVPMITVRLFI